MRTIEPNSPPAVLAVTDRVANDKRDRYEMLIGEFHQMLKQLPGFHSVDTVRHVKEQQTEYTVLLRFEDEGSAEGWKSRPDVAAKLNEIMALTGGPVKTTESAGLEMWVDHPVGERPALPPFWKRVTVSVLAVYPSLMFLMAISRPVIGTLPQPLQVLIIVVVLSGLLTWPIMPLLTRSLRSWLAPSVA
jgi:hypothetical protein